METPDIKQQFIELRAKGYSFDKIASKLGKAKQTLINWSKDLQDEIANQKALELEEIYTKYKLHKENRIETFGEMLSKIKEELTNRDLSDIPTDKLLDIFLKYEKQLKEEDLELSYKSQDEIEKKKLLSW